MRELLTFSHYRSLAANLIGRFFPNLRGALLFPPGHFYSPLVDINGLMKRPNQLTKGSDCLWNAIDLQVEAQNTLLGEFIRSPTPCKIWPKPGEGHRYFSDNVYFYYPDAFVLASMISSFKPQNIVEIGSGFSSALMVDVCEGLNLPCELTFIEPSPDRLHSLLIPTDWQRCRLIQKGVQDVQIEVFAELGPNDILFVDSSHVAKVGSDVVDIMLRILPALQKGVLVHFHDVFYPEPYPFNWLVAGRAWNESLFLRTFLQYNTMFRIVLFNSLLAKIERANLERSHRDFLEGIPASLWLKRVG